MNIFSMQFSQWLSSHTREDSTVQWQSVWILYSRNGDEHVQVSSDDVIDHTINDIIINCICSLLKESPTPTKQQVENFYDGNICRCTGNIYVLLESVLCMSCDLCSSLVTRIIRCISIRVFFVMYHLYRIPSYT